MTMGRARGRALRRSAAAACIVVLGCGSEAADDARPAQGIAPGESRAVAADEAAPGNDAATTTTAAPPSGVETLGGFSLVGLRIARDWVREGGPRRDQIRGVDAPEFVSLDEASHYTASETPVLGVMLGDVARIHPVHVIERHQVVNDTMGDVPVAVFYDPLAGTPVAARRRIGDRVLTFGVSGLVANGTALYFDRETESLWSLLAGEAIAGPLAGTRLETVRVWQEPRDVFLARAPHATVLARPDRSLDYRVSPYKVYWVDETLHFPVAARDDRYHPKELVLGVVVDGTARAWLGSQLTAAGGRVADEIAGRRIRIAYDTDAATMQYEAPDDAHPLEAYWFAWKAFHPSTEIWHPDKGDGPTKGTEGPDPGHLPSP